LPVLAKAPWSPLERQHGLTPHLDDGTVRID
jgi:hypothetical protein